MLLLKSCIRMLVFVLSLFGTLASYGQDTAAERGNIEALLERIETVFANGDIESAMQAFTNDAIIFAENGADIVGADAIRATYAGMMAAFEIELSFDTSEIEILGDTAYERGTFSIRLTDKTSGQVASDTTSRHMHILKRQRDGSWKTWRMMTNTPGPAA